MSVPLDLGPCCACGLKRPDVRSIMHIPRRAPMLGTGWGCLVCGLPSDGAVAVLCDDCVEAAASPKEVCAGLAAESHLRVPIADLLPGEFDHDQAKHEEEEANAETIVALRLSREEADALVALVPPGIDPNNWPPLGRVALKILAAAVTPPGTCMVCGCTDDAACPGGCSWVNHNATLCDSCLP